METTALLWLLNEMTHSPFMGTLMVTLRFLPMTVFAFIGGVAADRMSRRKLLIYALLASAVLSLALAGMVHAGVILTWHIMVYSFLSGILTSFNHPARHTLVPNLVRREHYLNAITMDNASVMASRITGTPLAGWIVAVAGTTPVLGLRAVGAVLAVFWLLGVREPESPREARNRSPLHNFTEGVQYVREHKGVLTQVLLFVLPIFVTNTYTGLLPFIATDYLHIGPELYGVLNAAPGAGAVVATFALASMVSLRRKGLFLLLGGIVQGIGLLFFAFSSLYLLSLMLLVIIGGANTVFGTLNNTVIQEMITDKVRGRVMSLREVSQGLAPAGSLVSGAIAGAFGATMALGFAGSVAILVLMGIMIALPATRER